MKRYLSSGRTAAMLVGTDADRSVFLTPAGKFTGRNARVLGATYSF